MFKYCLINTHLAKEGKNFVAMVKCEENSGMLAPLILKWEGKFADDPADAGGPTYMGITLKTLIRARFDKNKNRLEDFRFGRMILLFLVCFGWGGCKSTAQPGLFVTDTLETSKDFLTEKRQHALSTTTYQDHSYEEMLDEIYFVQESALSESQMTAKRSVENKHANTAVQHKQDKFNLYIILKLSLIAFILILLCIFIRMFRK